MIMHFSHFQCLIIGEITCDHMIIVLNKIDLFDSSKRDTQISKVLFTDKSLQCSLFLACMYYQDK